MPLNSLQDFPSQITSRRPIEDISPTTTTMSNQAAWIDGKDQKLRVYRWRWTFACERGLIGAIDRRVPSSQARPRRRRSQESCSGDQSCRLEGPGLWPVFPELAKCPGRRHRWRGLRSRLERHQVQEGRSRSCVSPFPFVCLIETDADDVAAIASPSQRTSLRTVASTSTPEFPRLSLRRSLTVCP